MSEKMNSSKQFLFDLKNHELLKNTTNKSDENILQFDCNSDTVDKKNTICLTNDKIESCISQKKT